MHNVEWDLRKRNSHTAAVRFLMPNRDGTLDWITGDGQAAALPGVFEVVGTFGCGEKVDDRADRVPQSLNGSLGLLRPGALSLARPFRSFVHDDSRLQIPVELSAISTSQMRWRPILASRPLRSPRRSHPMDCLTVGADAIGVFLQCHFTIMLSRDITGPNGARGAEPASL
ncbi:hypothetical protein [Mesorhizobium sp. M0029]|uniref:hypothetical protein n=1 Tax=Mesorhizobium sp. M0029 TaxID=2956850 RepID=UPI0033383A60